MWVVCKKFNKVISIRKTGVSIGFKAFFYPKYIANIWVLYLY